MAATIRDPVGPERRATITFDRGGWNPKAFAALHAAGFDILTYRKQPLTPEPRRAFSDHAHTDEAGRAGGCTLHHDAGSDCQCLGADQGRLDSLTDWQRGGA